MDGQSFAGAVYEPHHDDTRLKGQMDRVRAATLRGGWWTLSEIAAVTGDPPASISAQLRHLRKAKHGGFTVDKRHRGDRSAGLWEYRVAPAAALVLHEVNNG